MNFKEKILIVSPQIPEYDKYAGWSRLHHMIKMLSERYEVFLAAEQPHFGYTGEDDVYTQSLKDMGVRLFIHDYQFHEILIRNKFKLAIIEFFPTAERLLPQIRELQPDLDVVIDTVDVHYVSGATKANVTGDPKDRAEATQTRMRELEVCRSVEAIFTVTHMDRDLLLLEDPELEIEVIPTIHPIKFDESRLNRRDKNKMVFVGGFNHPPNIDAIKHFCENILPVLKEKNPDAEALIVGDSPPPEIEALASDNVKILGHVPDLDSVMSSSYISIAPLPYGSGIKGKILEALSQGVPVVTTSIGLQGLDLAHGESIMVADEPEKFAECVSMLSEDDELYIRLARNGVAFIEKSFVPKVVEKTLMSFLDKSPQALKQKRLARQKRERRELGFDIFQRYEMAADAIEFVRDGRIKVLDVGGRGDLIKFLPDDFVVTVDRDLYYQSRTFIIGDGATLPFRDRAFDFAIAMDVIEHIPGSLRSGFIEEIARVSGQGFVLGAPFLNKMNRQSEILINEVYKGVYGCENPWLSEHIAHRLPDLAEITNYLEKEGFSVSVLPNGYLPRWVLLVGLYYLLANVSNSQATLRKLSEFYNDSYYSQDNREPCYRHIIVALRDGSPPELKQLYPDAQAPESDPISDMRAVIDALPHMETLRFLHENEVALREAQNDLSETRMDLMKREHKIGMLKKEHAEETLVLKSDILAKENIISGKNKEIADREAVINNLLSKWPIRFYRKLASIVSRGEKSGN